MEYIGKRNSSGTSVKIIPGNKRLSPRFDIVNHSPDGFEWGYLGSGAAQLAFAILSDYTDDEFAMKHYQDFKEKIISNLGRDGFKLQQFEIEMYLKKLK